MDGDHPKKKMSFQMNDLLKPGSGSGTAAQQGRTHIGWRFWSFAVVFMLFNLFQGMLGTFITPILTTLERQFGLPSAKSGLLVSVSAIGYLVLVLFVSYLGRGWHKPLLFAAAAFTEGVAAFLIILPYLIFGVPGDAVQYGSYGDANATSNGTMQNMSMMMSMAAHGIGASPLCTLEHQGSPMSGQDTCNTKQTGGGGENEFNPVAFGILVVGVVVHGISMSPVFTLGIQFFNEILGMRRSSAFTGILFFIRYTSPVIAYVIASRVLVIFITLEDTELTPLHPQWLGAWWLGYAIFGAGCVLCGIILLFCPAYVGTKKRVSDDDDVNEEKQEALLHKKSSILNQFKGVNPVMYLLIIGGSMVSLSLGYLNFVPKYLEKQFHQSIATASVLAGLGMVLAGALGNLLSGLLAMRMRLTLPRVTILSLGIAIFMAVLFSVLMAIKCDQPELAGTYDVTDNAFNLTTTCNKGCSCEQTYSPVCGSDGKVYFSACHAGCKHVNGTGVNQLHTGCSCIPDGTATSGVCQENCPMVYVYVSIQFVSWFIINVFSVPILNGIFSCVKQELVGMVMGLYTFLAMALYFPSPIFFGTLVDGACVISHEHCGTKGACLWYDIDQLRYRLHLGPVIISMSIGLPFYIAAVVLATYQERKKKRNENNILTANPAF